MSPEEAALIEGFVDDGLLSDVDALDLWVLLDDLGDEPGWAALLNLTGDDHELYWRYVNLIEPQRIDSPESDGEGSWEGPDFDCCTYDDDEDQHDDQSEDS